jgi:hypothetical protein
MTRNIAAALTILVLIYAIMGGVYEHFNIVKKLNIEHQNIINTFNTVEKSLFIQQVEIKQLQKLVEKCHEIQ